MTGVFKAYDIRGTYPGEIDEKFARKLGNAVVVALRCKKLAVGRDVRLSSPALHDAFVKGVLEQGCDVLDLGICSTPMLYFAARLRDAVMVTASHTPKDFNGFKICKKGAISIGIGNGLEKVEESFSKDIPKAKTKGKMSKLDIVEGYVNDVAVYAKAHTRLKVVVDAGNGVEGIVIEKIAKAAGFELVPLNIEPNGEFPARGPNPMLKGAMDSLCEQVRKSVADFGAAYDADCDRIFFCNEKGELVHADAVTALIAQEMLEQHPKSVIAYDLRSSRAVPESITANGGTPFMTRVGHSFIKALMREKKAIFAGELSGHYYYASNSFADSGDITLMMTLNLVASAGKPLSELVKPLMKYASSGEINIKVKDKDAVMESLSKAFKDGRQTRLDGISVNYNDWWFNVRASNTEPLLRLNVEANTKKLLKQVLKQVQDVISS